MYSPDGKYLWTGEEWIPSPPNSNQIQLNDSVVTGDVSISNINVTSQNPVDQISNLADYALVKLENYNDILSAEQAFNDAKKLSVGLAQEIFHSKNYNLVLGKKYLNLAESKINELLKTPQVSGQCFPDGGYGVYWVISGQHVIMNFIQSINTSVDKALRTLKPNFFFDNITNADMDAQASYLSQFYRAHLLLKISGNFSLIATNAVFSFVKGPPLLEIRQIREEAFKMSNKGNQIISKLSHSDLAARTNKIPIWKGLFGKLHSTYSMYEDWEEDLRIRTKAGQDAQIGFVIGMIILVIFILIAVN